MRKVFIDVGALRGNSFLNFIKTSPISKEFEYYAIECQPLAIYKLEKRLKFYRDYKINIIEKAAWTHDGKIDFYLGKQKRCTLVKEYHKGSLDRLNKDSPISVPCFDFSKWIIDNFASEDRIYIFMNIEGAEYDILEKMIKDGSIYIPIKMLVCTHNKYVGAEYNDKYKKIICYLTENNVKNIVLGKKEREKEKEKLFDRSDL